MEDNDHCTDTKAGYVPLLSECKEEVPPELQNRSPCLVQVKPEPPHIKEEQEESSPSLVRVKPEPPHIKEEQEESSPSLVRVKPEPPHIKEEQEESSPSLVRVKPEPPHIKEEQEEVLLQRPEDADGSSLTSHGVIYGSGYVLHVENAEFVHLLVCKEEVSPEDQERNSSQEEELELPQIKEEQEKLLQRPEEADGSTLTLLAVKSEDDEPLASSTSPQHMKTQADVEDWGASQPTIDDQLPSSRSSESDIEDGDENREGLSVLNALRSHRKRVEDCGTSQQLQQPASDNQLLSSPRSSDSDTEDSNVDWEETREGLSVLNTSTRSYTGTKARFNCTFCHVCFANMSALKQHMRTHAGQKSFNCTDCDRTFRSKAGVRRHMHFHTNCRGGRSVLNVQKSHKKPAEGQMSLSEKLFMGLTSVNSFYCADCDISFRSKKSMGQHMHTHTDPNPKPYYNYLSID